MNTIDTLIAIRTAGGIVSVEDGRLVVDAPEDTPEAVWRAVAEHRDELVRLLTPAAPQAPAVAPTPDVHVQNFGKPANGEVMDMDIGGGTASGAAAGWAALARGGLLGTLAVTPGRGWSDPFPAAPIPQPAGVDACDRCGSTETTSATIHGGQSTRQDCARCGRLRKFTTWYGRPMP